MHLENWRWKPAVKKNIFCWNCSFFSSFQKCKHGMVERLRSNMESSIIRTLARSSESSGRIALFMILDASIVVKRIQLIWTIFMKRYTVSFAKSGVFFSRKQTHIHTSVGENMKPCEKSFDRFRNLLIILSRLCYTFIHSMSLRFVIVFWRLNYTKTIGFMLFLCQLLLNFQGA